MKRQGFLLFAVELLALLTALVGCASGPHRNGLLPTPPSVAAKQECTVYDTEVAGAPATVAEGDCFFKISNAGEVEKQPASFPVTAGVAIGVTLNDGSVRPAQLVSGNLKVFDAAGRTVGIVGLGGFSDFKAAKLSGGLGLYYELTPGDLRYETGVCVGALWAAESAGPGAFFGVSVVPKL